jgi:hypothetical protein
MPKPTRPAQPTHALEIALYWEDTLLEEWLFRSPRKILASNAVSADVPVRGAALEAPRALAGVNDVGEWEVLVPPAGLRFGSTTLRARLVEQAAAIPRAPLTYELVPYVGGSAALAAGILGLFMLLPPSAGALNVNREHTSSRIVAYLQTANEIEPPPPQTGATGGGENTKDAGKTEPEGVSLEGEAPKGEKNSAPRGEGRVTAQQATTSILGVLASLGGAAEGDESPWSAVLATASGKNAPGFGGFATNGYGGLAPTGTGRGTCKNPPCGETIGVGGHRTLGNVGPGPGGPNIGRGPGGGIGPREARVPHMPRTTADTLAGALSRDHIQRVIHRNLPKFRHCYEQSLLSAPDLAGRVTLSFIVRADGAVMSAEVASSDLASERTEKCLTDSMKHLSFDASPGVTAVTYPFVFQSAP